jgi:hypothetical protein
MPATDLEMEKKKGGLKKEKEREKKWKEQEKEYASLQPLFISSKKRRAIGNSKKIEKEKRATTKCREESDVSRIHTDMSSIVRRPSVLSTKAASCRFGPRKRKREVGPLLASRDQGDSAIEVAAFREKRSEILREMQAACLMMMLCYAVRKALQGPDPLRRKKSKQTERQT